MELLRSLLLKTNKSFFIFIFFLTACAGEKTKEMPTVDAPVIQEHAVSEESITEANKENYGPPMPVSAGGLPPVSVAESPAITEPRLCIVLGAGAAHGFAHVGVIEAIANAKIPIHCVLGVEMGAVVGGIYAYSANVNELAWQVFKLKEDTYFQFPLFSFRKTLSSGKKLNDFLTKIFTNKKSTDLRLPFYPATNYFGSKSLVSDLNNIFVADAISGSVAIADIFEPWQTRNGLKLISGLENSLYPLKEAQFFKPTIIVFVDVLGELASAEGDSMSVRFQNYFFKKMRTASHASTTTNSTVFLVQPNLSSFSFDDFSKQSEIADRGREKMNELLPRLEELWKKDLERYEGELKQPVPPAE